MDMPKKLKERAVRVQQSEYSGIMVDAGVIILAYDEICRLQKIIEANKEVAVKVQHILKQAGYADDSSARNILGCIHPGRD
jgi:hypothetical protein